MSIDSAKIKFTEIVNACFDSNENFNDAFKELRQLFELEIYHKSNKDGIKEFIENDIGEYWDNIKFMDYVIFYKVVDVIEFDIDSVMGYENVDENVDEEDITEPEVEHFVEPVYEQNQAQSLCFHF